MGWVAERMGPKSGHWKRRARAGIEKGKRVETSPIQRKRAGLTPVIELDQKTRRRPNEGKEFLRFV